MCGGVSLRWRLLASIRRSQGTHPEPENFKPNKLWDPKPPSFSSPPKATATAVCVRETVSGVARGDGASEKVDSDLLPLLPLPTMGFALERFAEAVDPDFKCKLCCQVLEEPLCTPCGHVFCASCLLPWVARRRRCPLQCQPLAPGKLYRVPPLRSLIQKLRIQCDYRARGCGRSVRLHELAAHVERCAFRPARRRRRDGVSGPGGRGGVNVFARGGCGTAPGPRQGGGARGGPPGVRGGSGRGPGPLVLYWSRREKALLAQLWALQGEVQLTARRYQEKFAQYMAHVRNFARDLGGGHGPVSAEGSGTWGLFGVERGPLFSGTLRFL